MDEKEIVLSNFRDIFTKIEPNQVDAFLKGFDLWVRDGMKYRDILKTSEVVIDMVWMDDSTNTIHPPRIEVFDIETNKIKIHNIKENK